MKRIALALFLATLSSGAFAQQSVLVVNPTGNPAKIECVSGCSSTGGDATAANQVLQIAQETAINTVLGLMADAACATDIASCTTISLLKRSNQRTTSLIALYPTSLGQKTMANSFAVVLASDQASIPVAATLQAGSAIIGNVRIDQTTPGTTNGVQVNAALPAGSNIIGNVRIDQTTPGTTNGVQINAALPAGTNSIGAVTAGVGITPTDRTITSATGSSQTVMSSNATRKSLTIVNTGNANCGVNPTGGTAAIGGAGTITLAPFGAYTPRVPSLAAITAICTAAQPLYADES